MTLLVFARPILPPDFRIDFNAMPDLAEGAGNGATSFPESFISPSQKERGKKDPGSAGHVSLRENKIPGRGPFVQRLLSLSGFVKFKARPSLFCQDLCKRNVNQGILCLSELT